MVLTAVGLWMETVCAVTTDAGKIALRFAIPDEDARSDDGAPLWLELPWQRKMFWRAVGKAPPELRTLVRRYGLAAENDARIRRLDRTATWFLEQAFSQAGRGWRPRSFSARAKGEFEAQAAKTKAATRELEHLATHGGRPSRALIEVATSRLGVGRIDWEMP